MEIKINKEIRAYKESIFFGLNFRQFVCSVAAVGIAVGVYFLAKKPLGEEMVSWVCMLAAAPVATMGFFKYQGMALERFITAWFRSEFLCSGRRLFRANNWLYQIIRGNKKI